ncbi:MAG: ADOP family duplicated permease [Blastocatellia bacterium]
MPDWKPEIRARLAGLRLAPAREYAIVEELAQDLDDCYADWIARGAGETEAHRRTLAELSEGEWLARQLRRVERQTMPDPIPPGGSRRNNMIMDLWQDLRYGARMLRNNPGFTLIALLTLALGIGANTAIFSVVDRVLIRALPVDRPEQLVNLRGYDDRGGEDTSFSHQLYTDYRDQNDVFTSLLAFGETPLNLSDGGQPERVMGVLVSGNFFDALGVTPALGRTFLPDEYATPGTHPVAVISHGLWRRRFGADPALLGRTITLNTHSFTLIGVAPAEFQGLRRGMSPDVYAPVQMIAQAWPGRGPDTLQSRGFSWMNVMGRLKPGVSRARAEAAMSALSTRIEKNHPGYGWPKIALGDGRQGETGIVSEWRTPLHLLLGMVALVLLIACVNIAGLLLARAQARGREMAVRLAVGASRARLMRQMLAESLLLGGLGGALGLWLAVWLNSLLARYGPPADSGAAPLSAASLDGRVLLFTLALSLLTALLFGLVPAWQASRPDLTMGLRESAGAAGIARARMRGALVAGQLALSLVVLVCAGLCLRSLEKLQRIDAGFQAAGVLVMGVNLSLSGYTSEQGQRFFQTLLERTAALPGAESSSLGRVVPLDNNGMRLTVNIEGYTPPDNKPLNLDLNLVGPRYCETLKLPLLAGRDFTVADNAAAAPVVIINQAAARAYWPGQNPLGKYLSLAAPGGGKPKSVEIVGITGDSRYRSLTESHRPGMLMPVWQHYQPDLSLYIRAAGDAAPMMDAARRVLRELDANLPVTRVRTLADQRHNSLYSRRVTALLLASFGGLALLLAALGVYGVMAWTTAQRTREIGVRMALGAQHTHVLALIMRQAAWLLAAGLALGSAGAWAAGRAIKGFLYEVSAADPLTFLVVAALLCGVALLACWAPARRALRVDPVTALRHE